MSSILLLLVETIICRFSVFRSGKRENVSKKNPTIYYWLTSCTSAELASRLKTIKRELPGRDGKILRDHTQECNVAVGGIGNLAGMKSVKTFS